MDPVATFCWGPASAVGAELSEEAVMVTVLGALSEMPSLTIS